MSDTGINDYYPEEALPSLVAGEAAGSTTPAPESKPPQDIEDLGIDLPDNLYLTMILSKMQL